MQPVNPVPTIKNIPPVKPRFNIKYLIQIIVLSLVYYLSARMSMAFNVSGTNIGVIWPPVGLMVAFMILMGYRIWPAVALGAFFSILSYHLEHVAPITAVTISLGQSVADVVEILLAVYLIKRFSTAYNPFKHIKDVFIFFSAAVISQAICALLGVLSLYIQGSVDWSAFPFFWMSYWISNVESIFILTPFILIWFQDWTQLRHITHTEISGHIAAYTIIVAGTILVFRLSFPFNHSFIEYFTILFIVSSAIILGRHGTTTATLLIAIITVWNTANGYGPFTTQSPQDAVALLEVYLITMSACGIVVSTLFYERKQSEAGLRKLQRAIEHSSTSIMITDAEGTIEYVNPRFSDTTGYLQDEIIGKTPSILKSGHTPAHEYTTLWETIKAGNEWHGEFLNRKKNGDLFWELANISPVINEKKQITHFIGIKDDITERKQNEQDLAALLRFKNQMLDTAAVWINTLDLEGNITFWNLAAERISGYSSVEVLGRQDIWEWLYPDPPYRTQINSTVTEIMRKGERVENYETTIHTKNGENRIISWHSNNILDAQGQIIGSIAIGADVTQHKLVEAAVIGERNLAQTYLDVAGVIILATDTNQKVTLINRSGVQLLKYQSASEIIGHVWADEFVPPHAREDVINILQSLISGDFNKAEYFENPVLTKSGDERLIAWHNTLLYNEKGQITGTLSSGEDITDRKIAEAEILHLNAVLEDRVIERTRQLEETNKELESFAYSISHDLRSPLRAINGFTRILENDYSSHLHPEARTIMDRILINTRHMGQLIDDLLTFSRTGRLPLEKRILQPETIIRQAIDALQHEKEGREVDLVIYPLPECQADPLLLKQVYINLISNALKFTRTRPQARIEIGFTREPQPFNETSGYYYVKDNGVGFDMQYVDKLFGVFQRLHPAREYEGTGVGLANVQRIIKRHGGKIWASAESGNGAIFCFTL